MFKIGDDHWIEGVSKELLKGGAEMRTRRLLVIHFTSGMSAQSSIDFWKSPQAQGACAHIIIDRDGKVIQCRPCNRTAGHAGISRWRDPKTSVVYLGVNNFGIGIELANAGDSVEGSVEHPKLFGKYPAESGAILARHKNGGKETLWEKFAAPQLASCFELAKALVERYNLDDVCGHEDIAPERKNDPGPAFPMEKLREACGFLGLPRVNRVGG